MLVAPPADRQTTRLNEELAVLSVSRDRVVADPAQNAKPHRASPIEKDGQDVRDQRHEQRKAQWQVQIEPELDEPLELHVLLELADERGLARDDIEQRVHLADLAAVRLRREP